jgi:hypothetical protein
VPGEVIHHRRNRLHQGLARGDTSHEPHLPVDLLDRPNTVNRPQRGRDPAPQLTLQRFLKMRLGAGRQECWNGRNWLAPS